MYKREFTQFFFFFLSGLRPFDLIRFHLHFSQSFWVSSSYEFVTEGSFGISFSPYFRWDLFSYLCCLWFYLKLTLYQTLHYIFVFVCVWPCKLHCLIPSKNIIYVAVLNSLLSFQVSMGHAIQLGRYTP